MNLFFLSMNPKTAARWHANIHIVKMIVETAQLLCNVHRRAAGKESNCLPPYTRKRSIPYQDSKAGHSKLGSMIWVAESLGNYRWAVQLGLELCREYNRGRGRAKGKVTKHRTEAVLEWLRDHEPNFRRKARTKVRRVHLAMPDELKQDDIIEAYRDYYFSKRKTMRMEWPEGRTPEWWEERVHGVRSRGGAAVKAAKPKVKARERGRQPWKQTLPRSTASSPGTAASSHGTSQESGAGGSIAKRQRQAPTLWHELWGPGSLHLGAHWHEHLMEAICVSSMGV